jgi:hypothetical protein
MNQPTIRPLLAALAGGALAVFATGRGPADCGHRLPHHGLERVFPRVRRRRIRFRPARPLRLTHLLHATISSHPAAKGLPAAGKDPRFSRASPGSETSSRIRTAVSVYPRSFSPQRGGQDEGGSNPAITQENCPSTTVFGHLVHPVQHPSGMQDISLEQPPPVKSSAIYF